MNGDLMGDIWENSPAKGAELILLLTIAYFADDEGFASETANTLARKARMSTDSIYRATVRLEEKGLLTVLQRGEGRAPSQYQLPRSGRNLRPQVDVFDLRGRNPQPQEDCACGRNLRPQNEESASWPQSAATSGGASGGNLRPQNASSPQSAATTDTPIEGTRADMDARVGGWEGTTPPADPPTGADRASAAPIDDDAFEFMASLDLKRTPRINEQREIADLFATKIAAGFTAAEIRDSVGGNWEGVRDRVRVLISRFKEMADRPLRRPQARPTAPQPLSECANCAVPVKGELAADGLCAECREDVYLAAKERFEAASPNDRASALRTADARARGRMDERLRIIRAAEVLADWGRMNADRNGGVA